MTEPIEWAPGRLDFLSDRFQRNELTGCLIWTGATNGRGYGAVSIDGRGHLAHRLAYVLTKGPIPRGFVLDHLCQRPMCVNPDHLEAVSLSRNRTTATKGGPIVPEWTPGQRGPYGPRRCEGYSERHARRLKAAERAAEKVDQ